MLDSERFKIEKVKKNKVYLKGRTVHNVNPNNNTYQVMEAVITIKLDNEGGNGPSYLIDDITFK